MSLLSTDITKVKGFVKIRIGIPTIAQKTDFFQNILMFILSRTILYIETRFDFRNLLFV